MNSNTFALLYESDCEESDCEESKESDCEESEESDCKESKESDYEIYKKTKPSNNLYIRPINNEDEIINFIQKTGVQITSCNIPTDRGFAFISVETNEDFDKILELDGTEFNNINMTISIAKKNKQNIPNNEKKIIL